MNYIDQINGFWEKCETAKISGIEISVYMALLNYCNRLNWKNPFICHWDILCQNAKISKNTYYKSIEVLEKEGFLTYDKGQKNTAIKPTIFILEFKNKKGTEREQKRNKKGTEREQQGNLDKHINLETINTIETEILPMPVHPLQTYVKEKFSRVTKLEKQLTYEECEKLLSKYSKEKIASVLMSMENYKKINNKVSVYFTALNWLERDNSKLNQDEAVLPPKKELKEIPASAIFTDVRIDYGNSIPPHER